MDFVKGETLIFDKPLEWTSFDLVNKVRRVICKHLDIKKLKVGHAGTLDPLATGVVVMCTGKCTKEIDELQAQEKIYIAELELGATTPSFDLETEIDEHFPYEHINQERLEKVLTQFVGRILQVPPAYSAVRVDGVRAYRMARKGKEVDIKAKELVIDSIEILDFSLPKCTLKILCSKGTYIRALARDIGEALDSGAHLTALRRLRSGDFKVEDAIDMDEFEKLYPPVIKTPQSRKEKMMLDDTMYMRQAYVEAEKALEKGEVPVGAVIVCNKRIIARAHNMTETLNDVTAHAEMQAITSAADFLGGKYLKGCTLYVTMEPCVMCAGALAWAQIGKIVYGAADDRRGFSRIDECILHPKTEVVSGILSEESSSLVREFFRKKR